MLRNILSSLLAIALSTTALIAQGTLVISPEKPQAPSSLNFNYTPAESAGEQPVALVYIFNEAQSLPTAYDVQLRMDKKTKAYTGQLPLPADAVFGLVKVKRGKVYDTNKERFWDFMVYGKDGMPRQGAYMRNAISYFGSLPGSMKRLADMAKTRSFIEAEANTYPSNIQAQVGVAQMRFEGKEISKEEFEKRIGEITQMKYNPDKESDVRAFTRALRIINATERANQIDSIYMLKYPQSEYAEENAVVKITRAESQEDFIEQAVKFLPAFSNSAYAENIYNVLANTYLQLAQEDKLKEALLKAQYVPASVYNFMASQNVTEDVNNPEEALKWNDLAMKQVQNPNAAFKPKYYTMTEFNEAQDIHRGNVLMVRGTIMNRLTRFADAENAYKQARAIFEKNSPYDLFTEYSSVLSSQGKNKEAFELGSEAIRIDKAGPKMLARHKELFFTLGKGDTAQYEKLYKELSTIATAERRAKLADTKLNQAFPISDKVLTTMDGKQLTMAELKGKVVLIDFWATWCGPCRSSFPSMQKLYEKYKNKPNVAFAIVNVWERNPDRKGTVKQFLDKNANLTFPVYFDEKDELAKILGVTGIPTKYFLDKNGVMQFKEVGFVGELEFIKESEDKIEVLLSQE